MTRNSTTSKLTNATRWYTLPAIVVAQFCGTSLWFAPNAILSQIPSFGDSELALLTSLVQVGFIVGTFVLTFFTVTDRFAAAIVFAVMSFVGALCNLLCVFVGDSIAWWATLRTLVGVCLSGIYPVGMKIAAKMYPDGLGARLGVLVGALTLGTAFPWLLRGVGGQLSYQVTLCVISALAVLGGCLPPWLLMSRHDRRAALAGMVPCKALRDNDADVGASSLDAGVSPLGAVEPQPATAVQHTPSGLGALKEICGDVQFRAAAVGYFGHMWELYTFWAYVPKFIESHHEYQLAEFDVAPFLSVAYSTFAVITVGAFSSVGAGLLSLRVGNVELPGSAVAAELALGSSMVCCLVAPLYKSMSPVGFFTYVLFWGMVVIADSGQFSSLCAMLAPKRLVGTALTMTTCVGFLITVISIQLIGYLIGDAVRLDPGYAMLCLAPGPVIGMLASYSQWPVHRLCVAPRSGGVGESVGREGTPVVSDEMHVAGNKPVDGRVHEVVETQAAVRTSGDETLKCV